MSDSTASLVFTGTCELVSQLSSHALNCVCLLLNSNSLVLTGHNKISAYFKRKEHLSSSVSRALPTWSVCLAPALGSNLFAGRDLNACGLHFALERCCSMLDWAMTKIVLMAHNQIDAFLGTPGPLTATPTQGGRPSPPAISPHYQPELTSDLPDSETPSAALCPLCDSFQEHHSQV